LARRIETARSRVVGSRNTTPRGRDREHVADAAALDGAASPHGQRPGVGPRRPRRERRETAMRRAVVAQSAAGVRLSSAALCLELDCNTVFDGSMGAPCPRCGSVMSYPLSAWLDRGARAGARPGSTRPVRALVVTSAA